MAGHTAEEIVEARRYLAERDPALARANASVPTFAWITKSAGFPGLVQLIIEQQVSTVAAASIWKRFKQAFGRVTPRVVLAKDEDYLRSLGLSSQKARYVHAIAHSIATGELDLKQLAELSDEDATERLMRMRGVGRWTAEAYLMGCEGRTDIFPAGDLGLQEGLRFADNVKKRLDSASLLERAEEWRPYRGVAAHLLWGYYTAIKKGHVLQ